MTVMPTTVHATALHHNDEAALIWQQCLFAFEDPAVDTEFHGSARTWLDDESWVDHIPGWLRGADLVFAELVAKLAWRQREVVMFDRLLPEPRLTAWWSATDGPEPLAVLEHARMALTRQYAKPFDAIGCNLYRDGRDSVAWHSDRERFHLENPVVAIVSTGEPRAFQMRPKGGGASLTWQLGQGDLFVMGGACQHQWEHGVPKGASVRGPRLSIMFRHHMADDQTADNPARYWR
jgi:alkylated DNA repair dioxygenase AlkB